MKHVNTYVLVGRPRLIKTVTCWAFLLQAGNYVSYVDFMT